MKATAIQISNFKEPGIWKFPLMEKILFFGINGIGKPSILRTTDLIYANSISMLVSSGAKLAQLELGSFSYDRAHGTGQHQL